MMAILNFKNFKIYLSLHFNKKSYWDLCDSDHLMNNSLMCMQLQKSRICRDFEYSILKFHDFLFCIAVCRNSAYNKIL